MLRRYFLHRRPKSRSDMRRKHGDAFLIPKVTTLCSFRSIWHILKIAPTDLNGARRTRSTIVPCKKLMYESNLIATLDIFFYQLSNKIVILKYTNNRFYTGYCRAIARALRCHWIAFALHVWKLWQSGKALWRRRNRQGICDRILPQLCCVAARWNVCRRERKNSMSSRPFLAFWIGLQTLVLNRTLSFHFQFLFIAISITSPQMLLFSQTSVPTNEQTVYIHPTSCLFGVKPKPKWLVYDSIIRTTKPYMRQALVVDAVWLTEAAPKKDNTANSLAK